jgi:hypothetical protein
LQPRIWRRIQSPCGRCEYWSIIFGLPSLFSATSKPLRRKTSVRTTFSEAHPRAIRCCGPVGVSQHAWIETARDVVKTYPLNIRNCGHTRARTWYQARWTAAFSLIWKVIAHSWRNIGNVRAASPFASTPQPLCSGRAAEGLRCYGDRLGFDFLHPSPMTP